VQRGLEETPIGLESRGDATELHLELSMGSGRKSRVARAVLFVSVFGLLGGCGGTEPGGEFGGPSIGATIFGVASRDGVPASMVVVRFYGFSRVCGEPNQPNSVVSTDSLGRYREVIITDPFGGAVFCFVIRAVFDRGGVMDSVTIRDIPVTFSDLAGPGQPRDSIQVDIALPP